MSLCVTLGNIVPKTVALSNVGLKTVMVTGLNHNFYCIYYKTYDFVPFPLPSRYHFQVIVTHHDTPSIIVTLPSLTVPHPPSPFPSVLKVTVENGEGRLGTVRDV